MTFFVDSAVLLEVFRFVLTPYRVNTLVVIFCMDSWRLLLVHYLEMILKRTALVHLMACKGSVLQQCGSRGVLSASNY